MFRTPGVEVETKCDQPGKCALQQLKRLITSTSPSIGFRNTSYSCPLEGVTGYRLPDDSNAYKSFGKECPTGGNCEREVKGRLFTRTTEADESVISAIQDSVISALQERAMGLGLNIVAEGRVFQHNFIK